MNRPMKSFALCLAAATVATGVGAASPAQARPGGSSTHTSSADGRYVVVADPAASALYVYSANGKSLTGKLTGVELGSHAGTTTLPDGRIVFVDDVAAKVRFLTISKAGKPRIVKSVAIPSATTWERAAWMSVDPSFSYLAFSSDYEDVAAQDVTIVDLDDYATDQISVPLNKIDGAIQETQVYFAGKPRQLVVSVGNEFRSYSLASILEGGPGKVTGTADLGYYTHGPVLSPDGRTVYSTTADGFDSARLKSQQEWKNTGSSDRLGTTRHIAYTPNAANNAKLQQDYRPRLAFDGKTVFGSLTPNTTGADPNKWASVQTYEHVVDLDQTRSVVRPLATGVLSRSAVSKPYAVFSQVGASADNLLVLNASSHGTFGKVLARVRLAKMSNGPKAGEPTKGKEARSVAITYRGDLAYVS